MSMQINICSRPIGSNKTKNTPIIDDETMLLNIKPISTLKVSTFNEKNAVTHIAKK